jgi:hypothetical protein
MKKTERIWVVTDKELFDRIEKIRSSGLVRSALSDTIRMILEKGLDQIEKEHLS